MARFAVLWDGTQRKNADKKSVRTDTIDVCIRRHHKFCIISSYIHLLFLFQLADIPPCARRLRYVELVRRSDIDI